MKPRELKDNEVLSGGGLSSKVVSGGIWILGLQSLQKGLGFVRTIILARFLAPDDFGLMGIALLALSTIEIFSTTGFRTKLVQKAEVGREYLDTAWTLELLRELSIAALLYFGANPIAAFFSNEAAVPVIRTLALAQFIWSFNNIGTVLWRKTMNFRKEFIFDLSGGLTDFALAVTLALIWRDVRALVWGYLAGQTLRVMLGYAMSDFRPRFRVDWTKAKELAGFGRWVLLTNIAVFLSTQGDNFLLGKIMGAGALGLYQMAYKISNLTAAELTHAVSRVTLPAFSSIQTQLGRMKDGFFRTLRTTLLISTPLTVLIVVLIDDFVTVFLGEKWRLVAIPAKVLAVTGLLRAIIASTGPVFNALGVPKNDFLMNSFRLGALAISVYPLMTRFGITGVAIAVVISLLAALPFSFFKTSSLLGIRSSEWTRALFPPLFSAIAAIAVVNFMSIFFPQTPALAILTKTVSALSVFALCVLFIDKIAQAGYLDEVRALWALLKKTLSLNKKNNV